MYHFDNEAGIIGNALFFLRMLSMCKHVYIAHFDIRFAQLVICMRLHIDRIQKNKIHLYCFEWCNLTSSEEIEAVSVCYSKVFPSQINIYL